MATSKEDEIKVRLPSSMKSALLRLADARLTSISEIAREALLQYVNQHGITADQLREGPTTSAQPAPPTQPVTYRKPSRKDTERKVVEIVKQEVARRRAAPPRPK